MARRDDDALTWGGDDDPTLDVGAAGGADDRAVAQPTATPGRGTRADTVEAIASDRGAGASPASRPLGNVALVTLGVIGGVYLLYAVGWIIGGLRLQGLADYLVTDVMFQGSFWLAVLAAPVWFATVLLLTRQSRPWVRFAWLIAGVILLVPWPFIMTGAVGT